MRLILAILATTTAARADSIASSTTATDTVDHRFALAVNEPIAWNNAAALAFSGYVAVTQHQVIRLNVATWKNGDGLTDVANYLVSGTGLHGAGRYNDFGASWMYFPRRAFDGPSIELGGLVRRRSTWDFTGNDDFSTDTTTVQTTLIGARSVAGWSWLLYDRMFISVQVGLAVGRESGTQVQTRYDEMMPTMSGRVDQTTTSAEAFMRFGVVL